MHCSAQTNSLLEKIEDLAKRRLTNRGDVGLLIESAKQSGSTDTLDELVFLAKFVHKTFGILKRIGKDAEGYDRVSTEFGQNIVKLQRLFAQLLDHVPEDDRQRFRERYLVASPEALEHLLSLCADLSWYKNFLIDSKDGETR